MRVEASAYAILGLRPGAGRADIDAAYRRLIKLHHPDRSGGDAARAAEINRAYFELRGKSPLGSSETPPGNDLAAAIYARRAARRGMVRPTRRRRPFYPLILMIVAALLYLERDRVSEALLDAQDAITGGWRPAVSGSPPPERRPAAAAIDADLADAAIAAAIARARRLTGEASSDDIAAESRECHRQMRADPSVGQLDRCAAFDYAVALLEDRDPVRDEGQFSASAVTARQMAAAGLVTSDFLAIEGRLDRIRGRVEMALAPAPPAMPIEAPELEPEPIADLGPADSAP